MKEIASMASPAPILRYNDVTFDFFNFEEQSWANGYVIVRNGDMVLCIPDQGDDAPYSITGVHHDYWWEGRSSNPERQWETEAVWILLKDVYVGTWVENNLDYVFRFRLTGTPVNLSDGDDD
ncbi:MAG: hypothetical protein U0792_04395 [Gemmataceae bacterium]